MSQTGVPQGCVLGPLNSILSRSLLAILFNVIFYTDDPKLFVMIKPADLKSLTNITACLLFIVMSGLVVFGHILSSRGIFQGPFERTASLYWGHLSCRSATIKFI